MSPNGSWFSDAFLDALQQNISLAESFDEGKNTAAQANPAQTAWLDGDGNGQPNEAADYQLAAQRGFALAGTFDDEAWPPYVKQAQVKNLKAGLGEIWAEVRDDDQEQFGRRVWALVYPPDYQAIPDPDEPDAMVGGPAPVPLISQGNDQYSATNQPFDQAGEYRIVIYAQDSDNLLGRPREIRVQAGWAVYLPLVLK